MTKIKLSRVPPYWHVLFPCQVCNYVVGDMIKFKAIFFKIVFEFNLICLVSELSEIPFCELEELKHKVGSKRYVCM